MTYSILVVDDEKDILELLHYNLQKEGYRVLLAQSGSEALSLVKQLPSLVVLDIMMPPPDGWEVCKAIRKDPLTANIPVIFLTARVGEADEVIGLELGADDYLVKPIKIQTFLARVKHVLRLRERVAGADAGGVLRVGVLSIQTDNYFIQIGDEGMHLPRKEFELLMFLARHPDRVVTRETLLNEIWGRDVFVIDRTIDVHVRKIRKKLGPHAQLIETVKGVGYRLRSDN